MERTEERIKISIEEVPCPDCPPGSGKLKGHRGRHIVRIMEEERKNSQILDCECGNKGVVCLLDCKNNKCKNYCIDCYRLENMSLKTKTAYHLGNLFEGLEKTAFVEEDWWVKREEESAKRKKETEHIERRKKLEKDVIIKEQELENLHKELSDLESSLEKMDSELSTNRLMMKDSIVV